MSPAKHLASLSGLIMAACQSVPTNAPARVIGTEEFLKSGLAQAMGRATVDFGPVDADRPALISVLPPRLAPLEGRSPALPTRFEIRTTGNTCYAVRLDDQTEHPLPGVECRAID